QASAARRIRARQEVDSWSSPAVVIAEYAGPKTPGDDQECVCKENFCRHATPFQTTLGLISAILLPPRAAHNKPLI
ncbi:MAG TPA: hypothetical protein PLW86_20270, partial [Rhodocyclaceae bacterium]|nr:hypothetical protein [Rhodocyclaceae bacterium]